LGFSKKYEKSKFPRRWQRQRQQAMTMFPLRITFAQGFIVKRVGEDGGGAGWPGFWDPGKLG